MKWFPDMIQNHFLKHLPIINKFKALKLNVYWVIVILCISHYTVLGQQSNQAADYIKRIHLISLDFGLDYPVSTFKERSSIERIPSFKLGYFYQIQKEKPTFIGAGIKYGYLSGYSDTFEDFIDNELIPIDGIITSSWLGIDVMIRHYLQVDLLKFEPFVEGRIGGLIPFTSSSERGEFLNGDLYEDFDFITGDFALSYGFAIGVNRRLSDLIYLQFLVQNTNTTSATIENKLPDVNPDFTTFPIEAYERINAPLNHWGLQIGVTFVL